MSNRSAWALVWLAGCVPTAPEAEQVELGECAGDADVDDTIRIAEEFEASAHEMIQCGSLTSQFIAASVATARQWSESPTSMPSAFTYEDGEYVTEGDGVRMSLELSWGPDSPGGIAGRIGVDLFDPDAFLVGATSETSDGVTTITFSEPGPLAVLLGRGADPASPIALDRSELDAVAANIGTLRLATTIEVDDPVDTSVVTWTIPGNPVALALLLVAGELEMAAREGAAVREDLGQDLATTVWDVGFVQSTQTLVGTIEADVTGGPFPFHAEYVYDGVNAYPLTTLTCSSASD